MTTNPANLETDAATKFAMTYADFQVMLCVMCAEGGEPVPDAPTYPDWVMRCGKKVCEALFPKIYLLDDPVVNRAYKTGLSFGMMSAGESKLAAAFEQLEIKIDREPTPEELQQFMRVFYGEDHGFTLAADSLIPEEIRSEIKKFQEGLTIEQQGNFFHGMADAHLMVAGKNFSTHATRIYTTMLVYWRIVDVAPSMEYLHAFLTKVHGQNIVGSDIKRTRQLCSRIGKRFRPPGRPKLLQPPKALK